MDPSDCCVKFINSGPLTDKLLSSLENQSELVIDFTSLTSCLNPSGHRKEAMDKDFDYGTFLCDLLENQSKTLPNLKKLLVRRILEGKNLTSLRVDDYDIYTRINYGMMQLSSLSELDLSYVPEMLHDSLQLWNLCNLTKLSITNSQLTSLSGSVGSLQELKELNLSFNKLKSLPITLSLCKNLKTVNLQDNAFVFIPSVLMSLKKLTTLKRHGCPLCPRYDMPHQPRYVRKIKYSSTKNQPTKYQPLTLQESCAREIFNMKINYWDSDTIGVVQRSVLDHIAENIYACDSCNKIINKQSGTSTLQVNVMLIVFKELRGVPFKLNACSEQCQDLLAVRYGSINIETQKELDQKYEDDMKMAQKDLKEGRLDALPSKSYTYNTDVSYRAYQLVNGGSNNSTSGRNNRRKKRCSIM